MKKWLITTRTGAHTVSAYQIRILDCGALILGGADGEMTHGYCHGDWIRFEPVARRANARH